MREKKRGWFLLILVLLLALNQSCENEALTKDRQDIGRIFFDYRISAEEGDEDYLVLLQFRNGGPYKSTITIDSPLVVIFDGTRLLPDSSKFTGPYYEVRQSITSMPGDHVIQVSGPDGVEHEEKITLAPIRLKKDLDTVIQRGDLIFELEGLRPGSQVRVLLTDTAFFSEGINRIDTVNDSQVIITRQELEAVGNGPIHLELIYEVERPLKERSRKAGWLSISYGLSREFRLVGN